MRQTSHPDLRGSSPPCSASRPRRSPPRPPPPPPSVASLRCEYKVDPLGIDVGAAAPELAAPLRGARRRAVRLPGAGHARREDGLGHAARWPPTGRSTSPTAAPRSSRRGATPGASACGTAAGRPRPGARPPRWEMGLLTPGDWKARWIEAAGDEGAKASQPAPMLRGTFAVKGAVRSARAYVTSLGLYELEINGKRVGDQLFTPGWTSYHHRLQYQTYDVTAPPARGRERDRRDARRRLVPRLPRLEGPAQRLRRPPRAPLPAADRVRGRPGRDRGDRRDVEVRRPGPIRGLGHLQRRDLRRPAGAAGLERAGLRRHGLGAGASW